MHVQTSKPTPCDPPQDTWELWQQDDATRGKKNHLGLCRAQQHRICQADFCDRNVVMWKATLSSLKHLARATESLALRPTCKSPASTFLQLPAVCLRDGNAFAKLSEDSINTMQPCSAAKFCRLSLEVRLQEESTTTWILARCKASLFQRQTNICKTACQRKEFVHCASPTVLTFEL